MVPNRLERSPLDGPNEKVVFHDGEIDPGFPGFPPENGHLGDGQPPEVEQNRGSRAGHLLANGLDLRYFHLAWTAARRGSSFFGHLGGHSFKPSYFMEAMTPW